MALNVDVVGAIPVESKTVPVCVVRWPDALQLKRLQCLFSRLAIGDNCLPGNQEQSGCYKGSIGSVIQHRRCVVNRRPFKCLNHEAGAMRRVLLAG